LGTYLRFNFNQSILFKLTFTEIRTFV